MFFIWGSKGRVSSRGEDTLEKACPSCQGDLQLSDLKKWFTLYFIPVFPYSTVDTFYHCSQCEASYKQEAREVLLGQGGDKEELKKESIRRFMVAYVACATYMSNIDGHLSGEERAMIFKEIDRYPEIKDELIQVFEETKKADDPKSNVMFTLRTISEALTSDGVLLLIAQIARLILADGKIDKEEEKLMKEFMVIAGVPDSLYETVMDRVKQSS